jgi:hypothetical protein
VMSSRNSTNSRGVTVSQVARTGSGYTSRGQGYMRTTSSATTMTTPTVADAAARTGVPRLLGGAEGTHGRRACGPATRRGRCWPAFTPGYRSESPGH